MEFKRDLAPANSTFQRRIDLIQMFIVVQCTYRPALIINMDLLSEAALNARYAFKVRDAALRNFGSGG